jgi:hypothetical protein
MQFPHTDERVYISVSPNAIGNIQRMLQLQEYLVSVDGLGLVGVGLLLLELLLEILLPLPLHLLLPAAEPPAHPKSNPNIISIEPKKWSMGRGFSIRRLGVMEAALTFLSSGRWQDDSWRREPKPSAEPKPAWSWARFVVAQGRSGGARTV